MPFACPFRHDEKRRHLGRRRRWQEQARRGAARGGKAGRTLEDRNREQLYELAKKKNIAGRSKLGKWELIRAIRRAG
jgi:hypothetical protein